MPEQTHESPRTQLAGTWRAQRSKGHTHRHLRLTCHSEVPKKSRAPWNSEIKPAQVVTMGENTPSNSERGFVPMVLNASPGVHETFGVLWDVGAIGGLNDAQSLELCYFQGHTQEQVSRRLGWPLGTVQTRLHRGRERLRARLSRRGIGLASLAATVFALPRNTATADSIPVASGWAKATASAAVRFAAGNTTAEFVSPMVVNQRLHARPVAFGLCGLAADKGLRGGRAQTEQTRALSATSNGSKEPRSNPAIGLSGRAVGPTAKPRIGSATTRTPSSPCARCTRRTRPGCP